MTSEYPLALLPRSRPRPPTIAHPTVSLVVPVRNEACNIGWALEQVVDEVTEIVLVDRNSTDVTLLTVRRCSTDAWIVQQRGTGKGNALRTGFLAASGDIIMMDADGSRSPHEILQNVHFLAKDYVKGSRFDGGGAPLDITWLRRLGNRFLLAVFNSLYHGYLTDLCHGFCAFDPRYLEHLGLSCERLRNRDGDDPCGPCRRGRVSPRFPASSCPAGAESRTCTPSVTASACCEPYCAITARAFPATSAEVIA